MRGPHEVDPHLFLTVAGTLLLLLVALVLIDRAFKWLPRLKERLAPVRTVRARVLAKRSSHLDPALAARAAPDVSPDPGGAFVSFFFDGTTFELAASAELYLKCTVGSEGVLSYRGKTAINFRPLK